MRKTDVADKYIIKKILLKTIDEEKNNWTIYGDIDFVKGIDHLRDKNIFMMLALLKSFNLSLIGRAKAIWV